LAPIADDEHLPDMGQLHQGVHERRQGRQEKFIPINVVPAHAKLQEQTRYLRD
jgi:hypothetical protein